MITWLVLFTTWNPAPTFMKVDEFADLKACETAKVEFILQENMPEKQARRLQCLTMTKPTNF